MVHKTGRSPRVTSNGRKLLSFRLLKQQNNEFQNKTYQRCPQIENKRKTVTICRAMMIKTKLERQIQTRRNLSACLSSNNDDLPLGSAVEWLLKFFSLSHSIAFHHFSSASSCGRLKNMFAFISMA